MITLYVKDKCGYCERTVPVFEKLTVPYEVRNISDKAYNEEFLGHGGKLVPLFVDEEKGAVVHESKDIIAHLVAEHGIENSDTPKEEFFGVCPV